MVESFHLLILYAFRKKSWHLILDIHWAHVDESVQVTDFITKTFDLSDWVLINFLNLLLSLLL